MKRSWIDQLKHKGKQFTEYWRSRSSKQKAFMIGTFLFLIIGFSIFISFASRPQYTPLYSGQLTQREVGDIKAELDKEGYTNYKLSDAGTMLLVPKKDAPDLVVSLASKGYPKDNSINYDVFASNLSFGATDRQYDILEREAMQTQVAKVIQHVDGIKNAEVILTLPQNSVFVRQDEQKASASVMVEVEPGVKLNAQQIRALYTLVSHSVPNLPLDKITIMNQYSETLPLQDVNSDDYEVTDKYEQQMKIQKNIQQDIQQNLQSLLGTILGTDKVFVSTFVKMNFDKVKTEEKLVKPVDDSNKGVPISSQKNSKSSSGQSGTSGGVVGTGETDVPGYTSTDSGGKNTYEENNETVNYEVSRINNEIIKSPYQIDDITINIGVSPDSPNSKTLSKATQDNIRNIVSNTVRTALGHPNLSQKEIDQRITIFPHSFAQTAFEQQQKQAQTNWLNIIGAAAAAMLLLGGGIWFVSKRKRNEEQELEEEAVFSAKAPAQEADYFAEADLSVENQLKRLLDQRPADFTKVIRTWLNEEEM